MNFIQKSLILIICIILTANRNLFSWFSNGDGGYPGEYLVSFSGSARGLGMGMAQASLSGQANLAYSNPASIAGLWWKEASFTISPVFGQGQFTVMSYGYPFNNIHAVGINIIRLTSGDAEKTNVLGESIGTFSDQQTAIMTTYARKILPDLYGGINGKIVTQDIDTLSEKGFGADVGAIYYNAAGNVLSLNLINIVPPALGADNFPLIARMGFAQNIFIRNLLWAIDYSFNNPIKGPVIGKWYTGLDLLWPEWFHWRVGCNEKQFSAGFGIAVRQIDIDYAMVYHPLDVIHCFTINVRYGFLPEEAEIKVQNDWDTFKKEKAEYFDMVKKENEKLRFERERMKNEQKLAVKFYEARVNFENKKFEASQKILEEIIRDDPAYEEAKKLLAEIKARGDLDTIIRRMEYARDAYKRGAYIDTIVNVNYILEIRSDHIDARVLSYLAQAQLYLAEKKYKDAKGELIEVIKISPDNIEATQLLKRVQNILEIYGDER